MKLNSPPPELKLARTTPAIFVDMLPPFVYAGVNAISSIPEAEIIENKRTRMLYGIAWMK